MSRMVIYWCETDDGEQVSKSTANYQQAVNDKKDWDEENPNNLATIRMEYFR